MELSLLVNNLDASVVGPYRWILPANASVIVPVSHGFDNYDSNNADRLRISDSGKRGCYAGRNIVGLKRKRNFAPERESLVIEPVCAEPDDYVYALAEQKAASGTDVSQDNSLNNGQMRCLYSDPAEKRIRTDHTVENERSRGSGTMRRAPSYVSDWLFVERCESTEKQTQDISTTVAVSQNVSANADAASNVPVTETTILETLGGTSENTTGNTPIRNETELHTVDLNVADTVSASLETAPEPKNDTSFEPPRPPPLPNVASVSPIATLPSDNIVLANVPPPPPMPGITLQPAGVPPPPPLPSAVNLPLSQSPPALVEESSQSVSVTGNVHGNMLEELRNVGQSRLRSAEQRRLAEIPRPAVSTRDNLLAEIRERGGARGLRSVAASTQQRTERSQSSYDERGDLVSDLRAALLARRRAVARDEAGAQSMLQRSFERMQNAANENEESATDSDEDDDSTTDTEWNSESDTND